MTTNRTTDDKFVVMVVGNGGCNIRQERMLKMLHDLHGDKIEIVRQSGDEIKGIEPDFVIMDDYPTVVPAREVYKPERYAYWQRGRWGQ